MRIRRRRGHLQTAIDTYTNSTRTVTLIGMIHVADAAFFTTVADRVDRLEQGGAEVHFELITSPNAHELVSEQVRDWIRRLRAATHHSLLGALLGLDTQHKMTMKDHWLRTDITLVELLDDLPDPERFVSNVEKMCILLEGDDPEMTRKAMWLIFGWMPYLAPVAKLFAGSRGDDRVIVDRRNTLAIDAALSTDADVVAMWGAAHLPGIAAGIRRAGFRTVSSEWLDAIRIGGAA